MLPPDTLHSLPHLLMAAIVTFAVVVLGTILTLQTTDLVPRYKRRHLIWVSSKLGLVLGLLVGCLVLQTS